MLLISAFFIACASAAGYEPSLNVSEQISGVIYHNNSSVTYDIGNGSLIVGNPAPTSPLSGVSISLWNSSQVFFGSIDPTSNYSVDYSLAHGDIHIPLTVKETIVPSSLTQGAQQQIRLCVEIENVGDANITGFVYQKSILSNLSIAWTAYDGGTLCINDTVTWALGDLAPGDKKHLAIAFNVTPPSSLYFPEAYIKYDYGASLTGGAPGFSGSTNTSFTIRKAHNTVDTWGVDAIVPDDSDFIMSLDSVFINRSDVNTPFDTVRIASYAPDVLLSPGCTWKTSLIDHFDQVPVYFISISYSLPYTLEQDSQVSAMTEPFTVTVTASTPTPPAATSQPQSNNNPYVWNPTTQPTPTPSPVTERDIVFISPGVGDVITNNTTDIETSVPPSADPGYVVYYGSTDNKTWVKLGQSDVIGNMSDLIWNVPQMNGQYYLRAEHYNSWGLRGIAFAQVLIAHEILPVDMTTLLTSGANWLMLLAALAVLLILLYAIIVYLGRKPVIYDSSALYALSRQDKDWLSELPGKTIRPDEAIFEIEGVDRIKMKTIKNIGEMRRLEKDYGLQAFDAMALQLARETGATLYTASERIMDICKQLEIEARPLEKIPISVKN